MADRYNQLWTFLQTICPCTLFLIHHSPTFDLVRNYLLSLSVNCRTNGMRFKDVIDYSTSEVQIYLDKKQDSEWYHLLVLLDLYRDLHFHEWVQLLTLYQTLVVLWYDQCSEGAPFQSLHKICCITKIGSQKYICMFKWYCKPTSVQHLTIWCTYKMYT